MLELDVGLFVRGGSIVLGIGHPFWRVRSLLYSSRADTGLSEPREFPGWRLSPVTVLGREGVMRSPVSATAGGISKT